jgi:hypothetical protein
MAKANLEKAHKQYKDFADKSRRKVNFESIKELGAHHLAYNKDHVNKCKIYGSKFKINQFQALGHEFRME